MGFRDTEARRAVVKLDAVNDAMTLEQAVREALLAVTAKSA